MRFTSGRLIGPALFLVASLLVVTAGGAIGQPGKDKEPGKEKKDKDKGPKGGPEKGTKELRKAFDSITDAAQNAPSGQEAARLLDHAKNFYRAAHRAHPDEPRRFRELALAATDAARGLDHLRRASYQPVANLPEPPLDSDGPPAPKDGPKAKGPPPAPKDGPRGREPRDAASESGPWAPALDALTDVHNQLATAEPPARGAGRDFFESAKSANRQARTAYEAGDYRKAAELARAAGAWLRVNEHLERAEWDGATAPPPAPEPKGKGAPPLPPAKN
ncbi:hypothetical protein J8F10_12940 [Gemmata sp. G18]|uniref:DUF4398 domain-containing protein n=1 Tax=Gemmata palustris TaxID=2822762 RepID=A0ABS5BR92_9BACT|nr:hypothetical protein [Gemmata palustris]MBP3956190.1 hypothetical protein [Gemmata palustris]